jgi:hypothetical protein
MRRPQGREDAPAGGAPGGAHGKSVVRKSLQSVNHVRQRLAISAAVTEHPVTENPCIAPRLGLKYRRGWGADRAGARIG